MFKETDEIAKTQDGINWDELYGGSFKSAFEGQIVKARVIEVREKDVMVDINYKSEGIISLEEFTDPSQLKPGVEVEVYLESFEDDYGRAIVSKRKADRLQGWDRIVNHYKEGDFITGRVAKKVKGGLLVDIGIEAFLPASLVSFKGQANLDQLLHQNFEFKIVKMNKPRRNVVLSRKDAIQREKDAQKVKMIETLSSGQVRKGTVKNITDFGAFINLGGIDGLLHITDMSWGRISHPSEMLAVGDEIEVAILNVDKESMKVSLGLKQRTVNPWTEVDNKYAIATKVKGKVVNLVPYGAFVELEKGVEGLVHVSELSWTKKISHPSEMLAIGDCVEAIVLSVDKENQKLSLGIKQIEPNPWIDLVNKYTVGTVLKGKVKNLTDQGAFIEIEEGIDGFVGVNDLSWTRKINHPKEILKKAQKLDVIVLAVEADTRKLSLGVKQLIDDPWPMIKQKCTQGAIVEGVITKVVNFGVFVELDKDVEGLIHMSELELPADKQIQDVYKVGDTLKAMVLKVDDDQRKIALSAKRIS